MEQSIGHKICYENTKETQCRVEFNEDESFSFGYNIQFTVVNIVQKYYLLEKLRKGI